MIINKDFYRCTKCKQIYTFDTSKEYSKLCPNCNVEMEFRFNGDCDTELAEKVKNTPPYDPTKDPNSPFYVPVVECPYCHSTDVKKITMTSKVTHGAVFGLFGARKILKQWHCNSCKSDF